jgi:hypothetical protein
MDMGRERYRGAGALASAALWGRVADPAGGVIDPALPNQARGAAVNRYSTLSNESTGKA